ncbi:MAG TPA: hypothetical protein VJH03_03855 [Blastocatellia bacterium]|nr:hypothetical protein [Blastocatellia bacterium]
MEQEEHKAPNSPAKRTPEDGPGQPRQFWVTFSLSPEDVAQNAGAATRSGMLDDWRGVKPVPIPRIRVRVEVGVFENPDDSAATTANAGASKTDAGGAVEQTQVFRGDSPGR